MISRERVRAASLAFAIHLGFSLAVALLVAFVVLGIWFPYPLRNLAGGVNLFYILIGVDIICGPVLTGLVYSPSKLRREIIVDLLMVAFIQLLALIYGIHSISQARPVVLVFEADRFVVVSASQVDISSLAEASSPWQSLSWTGPVVLGTRKARDAAETLYSIELSLRGLEPSARPGWWQSYEDSRESVKMRMRPLVSLRATQWGDNKNLIDETVRDIGLSLEQIHFLPLVSQKSLDQWVILLDINANIVGYLPIGGF